MKQHLLLIMLLPALCLVNGCQRTLYDWGSYEASVFRMYSSREDFSVAEEIDRLEREVQRTEKHQRLVPPGKLAHLGYLYAMAGDTQNAQRCLEAEKGRFPESEEFVEFLLENLE